MINIEARGGELVAVLATKSKIDDDEKKEDDNDDDDDCFDCDDDECSYQREQLMIMHELISDLQRLWVGPKSDS